MPCRPTESNSFGTARFADEDGVVVRPRCRLARYGAQIKVEVDGVIRLA
jgi:hypothetical protein